MEKYDKKRWLVLVASCIINFFIGTLYVWSVFSSPMAEYIGKAPEDLAIVFSIGNSIGFITMIAGGAISNKLGPKLVILIGGIIFGLGFVVCGFSTSVGGLILGYGVLIGLAMGLVYGCTISNSVKFFPDKAGFAGGLATAAYGISSVIWPPIVQAMITATHVTTTFKILGVLTIVVIVVMSLLITKCPAGYKPQGWEPKVEVASSAKVEDKSVKEMLTSKYFWVMLPMLFAGAIAGMMIISQAKQIGTNMMGLEATAAALIVSVIAICNALARILGGVISDKIGRINTILIVFVISIVGLLCIIGSGLLGGGSLLVLFIAGVCLVGIGFGCIMGIFPGFTQSMFGPKNQGINYGIMFIGFSLAGLVGPIIVSHFFKASGAYTSAFLIAIACAAVGFILAIVFKLMAKKAK